VDILEKSANNCSYHNLRTEAITTDMPNTIGSVNQSINQSIFKIILIYNANLLLVYLPHRFNYSTVNPLFKKGDRNCVSNYRPVSLLTSFLKVSEEIMCNRLQEHLSNNSIFAD